MPVQSLTIVISKQAMEAAVLINYQSHSATVMTHEACINCVIKMISVYFTLNITLFIKVSQGLLIGKIHISNGYY